VRVTHTRRAALLIGGAALLSLACGGPVVIDENPNDPVRPIGRVDIILQTDARALQVKIEVRDKGRPRYREHMPTTTVPTEDGGWNADVTYDAGAAFAIVVTVTMDAGEVARYLEGKIIDSLAPNNPVDHKPRRSIRHDRIVITLTYGREP